VEEQGENRWARVQQHVAEQRLGEKETENRSGGR